MVVDAETLEPARDGFSRVFGEATERIKPELFESFVEITTTVVETPEEIEAELRALRLEVAERQERRQSERVWYRLFCWQTVVGIALIALGLVVGRSDAALRRPLVGSGAVMTDRCHCQLFR